MFFFDEHSFFGGWVGAVVNLFQVGYGDFGVNARCIKAGVSQKLLDQADV